MQKLGIALLLFILAVSVANAKSQVKIENGELLVSPSKWSATGVKVTPEAQKYPLSVEEAFNNPGKLVVTHTKFVYTVTGLFHLKEDTISKFGVRYDTQRAVIDVMASSEVVRGRMLISPLPFFWMVTIVAFLVSITTKKGNSVAAITIAFITAFLTTTFAGAFSFVATAITALAATSMILLVVLFGEEMRKRVNIAFYVLMILSAGTMYYPLF